MGATGFSDRFLTATTTAVILTPVYDGSESVTVSTNQEPLVPRDLQVPLAQQATGATGPTGETGTGHIAIVYILYQRTTSQH